MNNKINYEDLAKAGPPKLAADQLSMVLHGRASVRGD